jgi:hypothetical protein
MIGHRSDFFYRLDFVRHKAAGTAAAAPVASTMVVD